MRKVDILIYISLIVVQIKLCKCGAEIQVEKIVESKSLSTPTISGNDLSSASNLMEEAVKSGEYVSKTANIETKSSIPRDESIEEEEDVEEDPGYDEIDEVEMDLIDLDRSGEEVSDAGQENTLSDDEYSQVSETTGMLQGFEGTKEPLPYLQELQDEIKVFGNNDQDKEDALNNENDDNYKRSSIEGDDNLELTDEDKTNEESENTENSVIVSDNLSRKESKSVSENNDISDNEKNDDDSDSDDDDDDDDDDDNDDDDDSDGDNETDSNETEEVDDVAPTEDSSDTVEISKRSSVAELDSDITGANMEEIEDNDEDNIDEAAAPITSDIKSSDPYELNTDEAVDGLSDQDLTEFEEDKEDLSKFDDDEKVARSFIPSSKGNEVTEQGADDTDTAEKDPSDDYELSEEDLNSPIFEDTDDSSTLENSASEYDQDTQFQNELTKLDFESADDTTDFDCDNTLDKKNLIEYEEYSHDDVQDDDLSNNEDDSDVKTSFDCSDCSSNQEEDEEEDSNDNANFVSDHLTKSCPNPDFYQNYMPQPSLSGYLDLRSEVYGFNKEQNVCEEKCMKKAKIPKGVVGRLGRFRIWKHIDPSLRYHRIPTSAVGFLVDGNLAHMRAMVQSFILNNMLLFSRDSSITVAQFRDCFQLLDLPHQIMLQRWPSYKPYINKILAPSAIKDLGPWGKRNVVWGLSELMKNVNQHAEYLPTPLKFIILITNGPFTNVIPNDMNLKALRDRLKALDIKLYIVQLGSQYNQCQLRKLVPPTRVIIVSHPSQLLFGGKLLSRSASNFTRQSTLVSGVIHLLAQRFKLWANIHAKTLGPLVFYRGGFVGWSGNKPSSSLSSVSPATAIMPETGVIEQRSVTGTLFSERDVIPQKRQLIAGIRPRQLRRLLPATGNLGYNFLQTNWNWVTRFPSLERGVLGQANCVFMVDTMRGGMMPVLQKLMYHLIRLFPVTVSKSSLLGMNMLRTFPIAKMKTYPSHVDIQRMVTTIPRSFGRALMISKQLANVLSPQSKLLVSGGGVPNVIIMVLTHNSPDVNTYRYMSGLIRSLNVKLYILGIGLRDQHAAFSQLTPPMRVFTSPTRRSFFSSRIINSMVRQFKRDVGTSGRVINLTPARPRISPFRPQSSRFQSRRPFSLRRTSGERRRSRPSWSTSTGRRVAGRPGTSSRSRSSNTYGRSWRGRGGYTGGGRGRGPSPGRWRSSGRGGSSSSGSSRGTSSRGRAGRQGSSRLSRPRIRGPTIRRPFARRPSRVTSRRPLSMRGATSLIRLPTGVVGPVNMAILVDATIGRSMGAARSFVKNIINSYQREGASFMVMSFAGTIRILNNFDQFKNSQEVNRALERLGGSSSRLRNTGRAMLEARRRLGKTDPGYPPVVMLLLNGRSSDDISTAAMELKNAGIKVISIAVGPGVVESELLQLASSSQLSFRVNLYREREAVKKILPLLQVISGSRTRHLSNNGRWTLTGRGISRQWIWKSFNSGIIYRSIAASQVSLLLDTTENPDSIVKFAYNIIMSFSSQSSFSCQAIGPSSVAAYKLWSFRPYNDMSSTQLALQSIIGNNAWLRRAMRRRRRGQNRIGANNRNVLRRRPQRTRTQQRDIISDIFSEGAVQSRQPLINRAQRTRNAHTPRRISTTHSPRRMSTRLQGATTPAQITSPRRQNRILGYRNVPSQLSRQGPLNGRGANLRNQYKGEMPSLSSGSRAAVSSTSGVGSTTLGDRRPSAQVGMISRETSRTRGAVNRLVRQRASRMRSVGGYRFNRRMRYQRRRFYQRNDRSWANIARNLRRAAARVRKENLESSLGPNRNKVVIMLLSGWPYQSRGYRNSRAWDEGFRAAAQAVVASGSRLLIVVMQERKTRNLRAQPLLRASSTYFYHGHWAEAQKGLRSVQVSSRTLLGEVRMVNYGARFTGYPNSGKASISLVPILSPILTPAYETYITGKFLVSVQKLRTQKRYSRIVPGIRENYIMGNVRVIIAADVSGGTGSFVVQDAVANLILLFNRTRTVFSFVTIGRSVRTLSRNAVIRDQQAAFAAARRFRPEWRGSLSFRPAFGSALTVIQNQIIRNPPFKRQNLVIIISRSPSRDDVQRAAIELKKFGTTISAIGIGSRYLLPELQTMASSGQFVFAGYESMLPLGLYRLQYPYSSTVQGPLNIRGVVSMRTISAFRPQRTILHTANTGDHMDDMNFIVRNQFTSKRNVINNDELRNDSSVTTHQAEPAMTLPTLSDVTNNMEFSSSNKVQSTSTGTSRS